MTERFEEWALVELFGHQRISGKISEQQLGGETFIRVDVPTTKRLPGYTKLYGKGAIYGITITDEKTATMAAAYYEPAPMDKWTIDQMLGKQKLLDDGAGEAGVCRECGCTETTPCMDEATGEPCHWVEPDLCSVCYYRMHPEDREEGCVDCGNPVDECTCDLTACEPEGD